ncbi:hypothetical protein [Roseateles flavus]|uniref:Glycosaminoglycan attachment site n=1 Tax=Roseateles flavus TaxID=3149041 RepID=A0ABV0GGF3_9BURK
MKELPESLFRIYALSLPRGHGFGSRPPRNAWTTQDSITCGILLCDDVDASHGIMVMRRRVDDVWTVTSDEWGFANEAAAKARIAELLLEGAPPEPLPAGARRRPALHDLQQRSSSEIFDLLRSPTHHPAAWMLNQLYLALPNPDANWVGDCQTGNFHTRLWEAQLLACFREQGLLVTQPVESPDFRIENRRGDVAWVEAVTANPSVAYNHVNSTQSKPPDAREELLFGPAALRFAKTLRSKLQRRYHDLPHVADQPFMIAIADFQAPGSMLWSREGLIGYLYGEGVEVIEVDGRKQARSFPVTHLQGPSAFPAGLFANDLQCELSAVIFSNACSLAKFNRVAITRFGVPDGLRYMRIGECFDRTPGALKAIPFCLDISSEEYLRLWPNGSEPWSAELEVFHNPFARNPVPFELLPEATHWFDREGEIVCSSIYEHSILWSKTMILNAKDRVPTLVDFISESEPEP